MSSSAHHVSELQSLQVSFSLSAWVSYARLVGRLRGAVRGCMRRFAGRKMGLAFACWVAAVEAYSAQLEARRLAGERVGSGFLLVQVLVRRRDQRSVGRAWRELLSWASRRRSAEAAASSKALQRARCCSTALRSFGRRRLMQSYRAWWAASATMTSAILKRKRASETIARLSQRYLVRARSMSLLICL